MRSIFRLAGWRASNHGSQRSLRPLHKAGAAAGASATAALLTIGSGHWDAANESSSAASSASPEPPHQEEAATSASSPVKQHDDAATGYFMDLTNPGDFDDLEDSRSFRVQELDGVYLIVVNMLHGSGPQDREPAMLQFQYQLGQKNADASFTVQDTRMPSLQATVSQTQPGAGRTLQLTAQHRLGRGLSLKGEAAVGASAFAGGNLQLTHDGEDLHSSLALHSAQQGTLLDLTYHQAITPQVTGGGSVKAQLGALLPLPEVSALQWGVFGSWHDSRRETYALGRYDGASSTASARYWRQVHKNLSLGTALSLSFGEGEGPSFSAGFKHALGAEGGSPSTLTANFTSDLKSGIAWTKSNNLMSQNISNTFFQTTISGVFDHKAQEHKLGLQLLMQY